MEFYKLFRFRGTIGVNKLSLGDMIGVEFVMIIIYIALASILALISPTLLFGFYVLWMLSGDGGEGYDGRNCLQRLWINVFTIVSVIYYIIDFHYGWLSHSVMSSVISKESLDSVASFNITIGLLSLVLLFIGHEIYRIGQEHILRVILFCGLIYVGFKFLIPIGDYIVSDLLIQAPREVVENL